MNKAVLKLIAAALTASALGTSHTAYAHSLKKQGEAVQVADSAMTVTPSRDWNRLSGKIGKQTDTWTLDGGQLNDVTFYGGIEPGKPLMKERSKKLDRGAWVLSVCSGAFALAHAREQEEFEQLVIGQRLAAACQ